MNSEILYITRKLGFPSSFGVRSGLGDFLEQYPDGIYAETGIGAPIGWESAAVWFGGASEQAAARFERMVAERNDVSRLFRTRVAGTFVITFLYRLKKRSVTAVPVGGGAEPGPSPIDEWWGLKLTMPEGGTVILRKNGSPTAVNLEVSTDAVHWSAWELVGTDYTYALSAGQTLCIRNTSETQTGFSTSDSNYYRFIFTNTVEAHGNTNSLLCKNADNVTTLSASCYRAMFQNCTSLVSAPELPSTSLSASCYYAMFQNCTSLVSAPELPATSLSASCYRAMFYGCTSLVSAPELPATSLSTDCYHSMFQNCTSLVSAPELPATSLSASCYYSMFQNCTALQEIRTQMTDISATDCLTNWLYNVSPTGDLYCAAELTIQTGASGIPSGWTRHDI